MLGLKQQQQHLKYSDCKQICTVALYNTHSGAPLQQQRYGCTAANFLQFIAPNDPYTPSATERRMQEQVITVRGKIFPQNAYRSHRCRTYGLRLQHLFAKL
jgi:hypothetical protein